MPVTPASERSPEWRRENGRKGGKASGAAKRDKKAMKEVIQTLLTLPLENKKLCEIEESIKSFKGLKGKNVDVQTAIIIKQVQRALAGDLSSAEFLRDTMGERPGDNVKVEGAIPIVISGEDDLED